MRGFGNNSNVVSNWRGLNRRQFLATSAAGGLAGGAAGYILAEPKTGQAKTSGINGSNTTNNSKKEAPKNSRAMTTGLLASSGALFAAGGNLTYQISKYGPDVFAHKFRDTCKQFEEAAFDGQAIVERSPQLSTNYDELLRYFKENAAEINSLDPQLIELYKDSVKNVLSIFLFKGNKQKFMDLSRSLTQETSKEILPDLLETAEYAENLIADIGGIAEGKYQNGISAKSTVAPQVNYTDLTQLSIKKNDSNSLEFFAEKNKAGFHPHTMTINKKGLEDLTAFVRKRVDFDSKNRAQIEFRNKMRTYQSFGNNHTIVPKIKASVLTGDLLDLGSNLNMSAKDVISELLEIRFGLNAFRTPEREVNTEEFKALILYLAEALAFRGATEELDLILERRDQLEISSDDIREIIQAANLAYQIHSQCGPSITLVPLVIQKPKIALFAQNSASDAHFGLCKSAQANATTNLYLSDEQYRIFDGISNDSISVINLSKDSLEISAKLNEMLKSAGKAALGHTTSLTEKGLVGASVTLKGGSGDDEVFVSEIARGMGELAETTDA